jgi:hypothetical protein
VGIYKQPNKWECGPFALKHALLMRGVLASEREITRLAGTNLDGTDEAQLERAAHQYGCDLPTIRKVDSEDARSELVGFLRDGVPCLLCVDGWDHWVTAIHEEDGQFIVLDSEKPEVIVVTDWPWLDAHWVYHEDGETLYDLHPLMPRDGATTVARFSLDRVRHLLEPENRRLARLWDGYVEDLITLCRSQEVRGGPSTSLGEFLRRHTEMLLNELDLWHGRIERDRAREVLEHMQFVADTYEMVIRQDDERRTISAIAIILALWAAGEFGVEPLFRRVPIRRIR